MQFSITVSSDDGKEFAGFAASLAGLLGGGVAKAPTTKASTVAAPAATEPKKRGRPPKVKEEPADTSLFGDDDDEGAEEPEDDDEPEDEDTADGDEDADAAEDDEADDEESAAPKKRGRKPKVKDEPAPTAKAGPALDLDKHLVPAFRAFDAANGRAAAKALLAKFKVASVRDIPADKWKSIMKMMREAA